MGSGSCWFKSSLAHHLRNIMKRTMYLYCNKSGDVKVALKRQPSYDPFANWIEVQVKVNIPPELFEKPKLAVEVDVEEKTRKKYNPVVKSTSFGLSELRAKLPDDEPTAERIGGFKSLLGH